jgi:signal transduction histidine kinase
MYRRAHGRRPVTNIVRNAIRVLRGVLVLRLLVIAFAMIVLAARWTVLPPLQATRASPRLGFMLLVMTITTAVTMLFLFVPGLERRIGHRYLPIALTMSIVAFSLEAGIAYLSPGTHVLVTLPSGQEVSLFWAPTEMVLLILVPCVLAGAAYGLRGALRATTLAVLLHLMSGVVVGLTGGPLRGFLALLPLRIAVLYTFPLITGYLADTWRQEHMAVSEANRQLRGYAATVEHLATSRERVRLARAMHDTLAHSLSALVVQLEAIDALQETDPAAAKTHLERVRQLARDGLTEARSAILDLRSSPVEESGLDLALAQLVERFGERNGVRTEWLLQGDPAPLLPAQANALYRIAEEGLDNVEYHAGATRVRTCLSYEGGVTLSIEDDGQGFDPEMVPADRYGLVGIYERAALVDGKVDVSAAPNRGTTVTVHIAEPWRR